MSEQVFTIPYRLGDKARLFDVGQGIHSTVSLIVKRNGGKVLPFSVTLRRMKVQVILFALLALIPIGMMLYHSRMTLPELVMAVGCIAFGVSLFLVWKSNKESFDRTLQKYLESEDEGGTLLVDDKGITECSETGAQTRFLWSEYRHCIVSDEVIVITSLRPVMIIIGRSEETERGLRQALAAFAQEKSLYEVKIVEARR